MYSKKGNKTKSKSRWRRLSYDRGYSRADENAWPRLLSTRVPRIFCRKWFKTLESKSWYLEFRDHFLFLGFPGRLVEILKVKYKICRGLWSRHHILLTAITGFDVISYIKFHVVPFIMRTNSFICSMKTRMTRHWGIMKFFQNFRDKILTRFWNYIREHIDWNISTTKNVAKHGTNFIPS